MKQLLINSFKFYIYFNIHVALAVVALYMALHSNYSYRYASFLFFSTISAYNFIRLFNFGANRFFIKKFFVRFKYVILSGLIISTILSLYFLFHLPFPTHLLLIPFFLISFFYNLNFKYAPFLKLRNNGIVKIISVAVVWTGMIILIPAWIEKESLHIYLPVALWVFFYIWMLTLSFDQRDLYIDAKELKTIPQLYLKRLKLIYSIFTIILLFLSYFIFPTTEIFKISAFILFSTILCYRSNEHKSYYYTAFWIEALAILLYILKFT